MPPAKYDLNDLQGDTANLARLLATTYSVLMEMDYGSGPTRNHSLDQVAALTAIARDMAEGMEARIAANFRTIGGAS